MTSEIKDILENMTTAAPEMEDYIGEDGLLYCGKCHTPKEAYFPEGKELFGRDRHPAECDCQRAAREQRQAAEEHRRHVEAVENLKQRAFADSAMQQWTFENDNGRNPQTGIARRYAEHWEEMQAENIGCLFWGNVGNGKSYLAGCIANALMVAIAVLCSWVGALCWNVASQRLPTVILGPLIVFETLAGLLYTFLIRQQMPPLMTLSGIALLVVGVVIAVRAKPEKPLTESVSES